MGDTKTMAKREKLKPMDGLGPAEIKKIRNALRLIWQRSLAHKLVKKRCTDKAGYLRCELCKKRTSAFNAFKVDHIVRAGDVDEGYVKRLMVPSVQLQGMCHKCHNEKTKAERALNKPKRVIRDFY